MLAKFSVNKTESKEDAAKVFQPFLLDDENILRAFKHTRDKVVFTNQKIICYDVQGITGSKKEFKFFPYSKITSFSIETAGLLDGDSDFKIWVSGVGVFEIKFGRSIDVGDIAKILIRVIK
jgi:hypothetical protein